MTKAEDYDEDDDIQVYKKHRHEGEEHMTDVVNHPPHYKDGGIETIDYIRAKNLNYYRGNAVKYISRAGKKSKCPVEDLKKAVWYLNYEIETLENDK
jgi:hypothetical protein